MRDTDERFGGFEGVVETEAELRHATGPPFQPSVDKVIDHIDQICAAYIARSSFMVIASGDGAGGLDVSPKGDPAGFVRVLDRKHLAIPDRPGNRHFGTFKNILRHPRLALLFLIRGHGETLRVHGEARIVRDPALRATMAVGGRAPALATVLYVERAMIHCPKCVIRSGLWSGDATDAAGLPGIGEAMAVHAHLHGTPAEQEEDAARAGVLPLY